MSYCYYLRDIYLFSAELSNMESGPCPYDIEPTFTEEELCSRDEDREMEEDSRDIVRLPGSSGPTDRRENTKWSSQMINTLFGTNFVYSKFAYTP